MDLAEAGDQEVSQEVGEGRAVRLVFEHWKLRTGRPHEELTPERRKIVNSRLKENMSTEVLCQAIDAASVDDFYQGRTPKNPGRKDTLDVILGNRDRVLRLASASGLAPQPVLNQAAAATARTFKKMFGHQAPTTIEATAVDISQVTAQ